MPKTFSDKERTAIVDSLRKAAAQSMSRLGVRRTTVDELARAADISKGTFYLFYQSKELLLFDVILGWHERIHGELSKKLAALSKPVNADELTDIIMEIFIMAFDTGLLKLMTSGDIDALIRKLPDETVAEHIGSDALDFEMFAALLPGIKDGEKMRLAAAFRALFFSVGYRREIGADVFDDALRMLIRGLALQMTGVKA